jgi:hypothetical protein
MMYEVKIPDTNQIMCVLLLCNCNVTVDVRNELDSIDDGRFAS